MSSLAAQASLRASKSVFLPVPHFNPRVFLAGAGAIDSLDAVVGGFGGHTQYGGDGEWGTEVNQIASLSSDSIKV